MMNKRTLERWLTRAIVKAIRVELVHSDSEEKRDRVVISFDATACKNSEGVSDTVAEILATAQDETDMQDARASYTLRVISDGGIDGERISASTRIRCEPVRDRGDEAAPDEPNKTGVIAALLEQNRLLHRIVADAPDRQRRVYGDIIDMLLKDSERKGNELAAAYSMLNEAGVEDAETRAQRVAEEQSRSVALSKALGEGLEIVKFVAAKHLGMDIGEETPDSGEPH